MSKGHNQGTPNLLTSTLIFFFMLQVVKAFYISRFRDSQKQFVHSVFKAYHILEPPKRLPTSLKERTSPYFLTVLSSL